jgi:ATP-dependent Clp protease ATP-binding subunit ClpC
MRRTITPQYLSDNIAMAEILRYAPWPLPDGSLPPFIDQPVRWQVIATQLADLEREIGSLAACACLNRKRETLGVEEHAARLAETVLPEGGVFALAEPCWDLVFDTEVRLSPIPWEMFEDCYLQCTKCGKHMAVARRQAGGETVYCPDDGAAMTPVAAKLGISRVLTHNVRPSYSFSQPEMGKFLLLFDPTGELTSAQFDPHGICKEHLKTVYELVSARFKPLLIEKPRAEVVLAELQRPDLAGVYYFGHGVSPAEGGEGSIVLADRPLYAYEIARVKLAVPFVFLNACGSANDRGQWVLDRKYNSVAYAFAQGPAKTVIGSLWHLVNVQAARSGTRFFQLMFEENKTCAEALRIIRQESLALYLEGQPEISWMSYRLFGEPDRCLLASAPSQPAVPGAVSPAAEPEEEVCPLFDAQDRLDESLFAFPIDDVLLRAAKRRNLQNRAHVTIEDFLAGLIRVGNLTRFLCRRMGLDPDPLYKEIRDAEIGPDDPYEEEAGGEKLSDWKEKLVRFYRRWIVGRKQDFEEELIRVLTRAWRRSPVADESSARRISERAVLESFLQCAPPLSSSVLDRGCPCSSPSRDRVKRFLPAVDQLDRLLAEAVGQVVDENGCVIFGNLDDGARRVIDAALELAQQRGVSPISKRLVLAAFLTDPDGCVARACDHFRIPRDDLRQLMIAATEANRPNRFALTSEACSRIILPMVDCAQEMARAARRPAIDEAILFRAFAAVTPRDFKAALLQLPWRVDLEALAAWPPPTPSDKHDGEGLRLSAFAEPVVQIVREASELARQQGFAEIRTPHLFAAMIGDGATAAGAGLSKWTANFKGMKSAVLSIVRAQSPCPAPAAGIRVSTNCRAILDRAVEGARRQGRPHVTEEDLLRAFFADGGGIVGEMLAKIGIEAPLLVEVAGHRDQGPPAEAGLLRSIGEDLTEEARSGRLSEIVGRDREIETALETLLLTENANPLLIGEAGIGKTAIVQGIAQRIVSGRCPRKLRASRIVEISAGSLVAGTRLRGEFEQRMQQLLKEAQHEGVILFIDELHTIVGAGLGEGGGPDAANMLKTALGRGEIRVIGATTPAECRRTIERDKALWRRFQAQRVQPPSREATLRVLEACRNRLQQQHEVEITDEAQSAAVDLSGRYILDTHWPAKARDVLDRASTLAETEAEGAGAGAPRSVTAHHVARVVSALTGVPVERVSISDRSALATLEDRLSTRIVGQPQAIRLVAEAIRRGREGLADADRPWGVFLFVGPCGVGKTELAKILAEEVYGEEQGLIRFDMGDFSEPHSTARLVGAPPGYVGYDQGAPLVERLRRRPYSLLLLDEIEHAHEHVLAVLLRLFSEGTLTDVDDNVADARNSIVVMTSNILNPARKTRQTGFVVEEPGAAPPPTQAQVRASLERRLPRKLIDRIDSIVLFNPLTNENLRSIAEQRTRDIVARATAIYGVPVEVAPDVFAWVARQAESEGSGARAIQRVIDSHISIPLARKCGESESADRRPLVVTVVNDAIQIQ